MSTNIKQLTIYKNTFQSDTIDSTYSICSLSSLDTAKYFISWTLPYTIEKAEDTSSLYLDSNSVFHLPVGTYTIRVFDSANCSMTVTNLSVIMNSPDTLMVDSTIFARNWTGTGVTAQTTVIYFPSLHGPYTIQDLSDSSMLPDTSDFIYLHEGNYLIKGLDSASCQVVFTNLTVEVDTPWIETQDTTVYFCQWNDSSSYEYDTLLPYLPLTIIRTSPTADTMFTRFLTEGTYFIKYFDTIEGVIFITNLSVSPNDIEIDTVSKSMSYCDWTAYGFDTFNIYGLGYVRYTDSLPNSIEIVSSALDSVVNDSLIVGTYIVTSFDYENCRKIITNLTVTTDTSSIVTEDSTIYYCNFESSGFNAHNYASYYTPYITPRVTVVRTSPSVDTITDNRLTAGEYTITVYAVYECTRFVTNLTVTATSPDIEYLDTSLSYCDASEWSCVPYSVSDTLPYTFIMTSPVADSSLSGCLKEGSYVIRHYDTVNCMIIQTDLTVTATEYDTSYSYQTLEYDCYNDSFYTFAGPCGPGTVIRDTSNVVIEAVNGFYHLDPYQAYYTSYCPDSVNCDINKVTLTFSLQTALPFETTDYAGGTFDRREGDTCCFVAINHLECSGTELEAGDTIEIFEMEASLLTSFLLKTTIEEYGSTDILGFKFCPPQWDLSEEHINDWYSIVLRKDTCEFCRFDFMCDSTFEPSFIAPINDPDKSGLTNKITDNKSVPNISKVNNVDGSITMIMVYPNPASNDVNIKIRNILQNNMTLNIYDNTGKRVFTNDYDANKDVSIRINMIDFSDGVYTINIPDLNYNYKLVLIK